MTTKVYCEDCKWSWFWEEPPLEFCIHPHESYRKKEGDTHNLKPSERNANNDCRDYEKK